MLRNTRVFRCRKACWSAAYRLYLLYGADEKATFTLSRDHAQTEAYIKKLGFTYTFLRDNFYLDFFIDIALENGEIRGPAGRGRVSAVARKDTSRVAAEILLNLRNGKIKP